MSVSFDFMTVYKKVRPIVLKAKGSYSVKLWESDDWHQEGMIALYDLLVKEPELMFETHRLCVYFKTKFTNRVKDALRKQESQKRQFDRMAYEEIGEVGHMVACRGLDVAEYVAYEEAMGSLKAELTANEIEQLSYLMSGECFRGKRAFQRKLRGRLSELGWGPDFRWL